MYPYNTSSNIIFVNSEFEARQYPIRPGTSVLLMSSTEPEFYLKEVTHSNYTSFKVCDFTVREDPASFIESLTPIQLNRLKELLQDESIVSEITNEQESVDEQANV